MELSPEEEIFSIRRRASGLREGAKREGAPRLETQRERVRWVSAIWSVLIVFSKLMASSGTRTLGGA